MLNGVVHPSAACPTPQWWNVFRDDGRRIGRRSGSSSGSSSSSRTRQRFESLKSWSRNEIGFGDSGGSGKMTPPTDLLDVLRAEHRVRTSFASQPTDPTELTPSSVWKERHECEIPFVPLREATTVAHPVMGRSVFRTGIGRILFQGGRTIETFRGDGTRVVRGRVFGKHHVRVIGLGGHRAHDGQRHPSLAHLPQPNQQRRERSVRHHYLRRVKKR